MFVICDENDVIQDIATERENLSRGLGFTGYKLWPDVKVQDIQIGDTFDGVTLTPNVAERNKKQTHIANEKKVSDRMRKISVVQLIAEGKLPADYK